MKYDSDSIVAEIMAAIAKVPGTDPSDFYVGITNDIDRRLYEHNVDKRECLRILEATNKDEAEVAEITLIHSGLEGHPGGGTTDTNIVYCYQRTKNTKP